MTHKCDENDTMISFQIRLCSLTFLLLAYIMNLLVIPCENMDRESRRLALKALKTCLYILYCSYINKVLHTHGCFLTNYVTVIDKFKRAL